MTKRKRTVGSSKKSVESREREKSEAVLRENLSLKFRPWGVLHLIMYLRNMDTRCPRQIFQKVMGMYRVSEHSCIPHM